MTYEEKLQKILDKLTEERSLTRKNHKTKVLFNDSSFTKVKISDICKILLQLQDDEKALHILDALQPLETVSTEQIVAPSADDNYEGVEIISVELDESFDDWYEKYLTEQKSKPENLDWINLLKILDICSDINEKLQISRGTVVLIQSFPYPYIGRFRELFPFDTAGTRKNYQQYRWESIQFLQLQGVASEVKPRLDDLTDYGDIHIKVIVSKFDSFHRSITAEFEKRKKSFPSNEEKPVQETFKAEPAQVNSKVTYNAQKGELDIEGKRVKLNKDSFRAKLLGILLKDDKSRKKEWSWDEVVETIEGTENEESTKENKSKFYPACDGLAKHIASKTGANDLLIFTKSTVQINPKYI